MKGEGNSWGSLLSGKRVRKWKKVRDASAIHASVDPASRKGTGQQKCKVILVPVGSGDSDNKTQVRQERLQQGTHH